MIILGIDPGLARTGYAVIRTKGKEVSSLIYGCVTTPAHQPLEKRIHTIYRDLKGVIKKHHPEKIAVEQLFFCKNVKTALVVGQARGLTYLLAAENKIHLSEYTPLQVKQSLTGYGRASKEQIQKMLKVILGLKQIPRPDDAADALAIALCCFQTKNIE